MHPNEKAVSDAIHDLNDFPLSKIQQALVDYLLFHVEEVTEVIESEVL